MSLEFHAQTLMKQVGVAAKKEGATQRDVGKNRVMALLEELQWTTEEEGHIDGDEGRNVGTH